MVKLPKNPRTHCYFGCEEGGPLHHFPKPDRDRERFDAWKKVLDNDIKIKGDAYIYNQLRLCNKHFEDYYISPSKCLTRNAVPTLYITGLLSGTTSSSEAAEVSVEPTASVITSDGTNSNMKQTFVEGTVHHFPPNLYPHTEKYDQWKMVLSEKDRQRGDNYINNNIRICDYHFEECYRTASGRLTKNAVPTLNIGSQRLHWFPNPEKDIARFRIWVHTIGGEILSLSNENIYKLRRVCHAHFEEKYCCLNNRISNIAIPTLLIPDPLSISKCMYTDSRPFRAVENLSSTSKDNQSVSRENQGLQEAAPSTVDEVLDTSVTAEVQESLDKSPSPVEEEADAPVEVKEVCRICLAFHVKMYNIQEHNLCQMLYDIAGIKVGENDGIFQYVCYECAARLSAASAFRHKALKSDGMLQRLMNCGDTIAEQITFLKENLEILKPTLTVQEVFITTDIAEEPNIKLNLIDDKAVETTHAVIKENYKDIVKTFCDVETIDNFVPTERSLTMKNIKEHESTTLHGEEDNCNAITKEELTRRVRERLQELKCCNVPDLVKEFGVTTELVQKIIDDAGLKKGYKRKKDSPQNQRGAGKKSKVS
ncbi:uncharacterized protein LOC124644475 isoform X2 [Helicoverpa zea]|uniref:uncharacterized protein LOC124644475 isoform X2 n=1 Tax=Helicoverpa zea TaxID=7113 RepID=UPI001F560CE0|nr:uncharacterized protein LOC124644475 isoform X2 [Helicoverpa zea]